MMDQAEISKSSRRTGVKGAEMQAGETEGSQLFADEFDLSAWYTQPTDMPYEDINKMSRFTDCVIHCAGQGIPAHRAFLAKASKYFTKRFSNGRRESITGELDLSAEPEWVVHAMLQYVYESQYSYPKIFCKGTTMYLLQARLDLEVYVLAGRLITDGLVTTSMQMFVTNLHQAIGGSWVTKYANEQDMLLETLCDRVFNHPATSRMQRKLMETVEECIRARMEANREEKTNRLIERMIIVAPHAVRDMLKNLSLRAKP